MTRNVALAAIAVLSGAIFLAGCTGGGGRRPLPNIAAAPLTPGIEGNWVDHANTGVTSFFGTRFQTVATDTGNKLAEGTYQFRDQTLVELTGFSLLQQKPVAFNCALAGIDQLNCTASTGQQSILRRYDGPLPQPVADPSLAPAAFPAG